MAKASEQPLALIVEDSAETTVIMERAFQTNGFRTQTVYDGSVAVDMLETVVPAVLLLDLHLPHVNGLDILERIRTRPALNTMHIIVTSANPVALENVSDDVAAILVKPLTYNDLRNVIAHIAATI